MNRKHNEEIADEIKKLGIENTYQNRLKYKLWEELDSDPAKRCCPYTGRQIPLNAVDGLFSNKFEIEHILPKSKTFDDRPANKTVSYYQANRFKGERSPFDAFGENPENYNWKKILDRGEKLPRNKRWRFYPDAMKNFQDQGELISRMLTDTQYMSRVAKEYMSYVCGDKNVWAIPGKLTAKFRAKWGLNELLSENKEKTGTDNRHHAVDAFVVACTDRAMLQKVARATERTRERFIEEMPSPFYDFSFQDTSEKVDKIVVSYKPDHGNAKAAILRDQTVGQLHDETAYGFVSEDEEKGKITLSIRKPLTSLDSIKNIREIASTKIRNELIKLTDAIPQNEIKDDIIPIFRKNRKLKRSKNYM